MLPRGTCGRFSESESLLDLIDCFVFGEMDPLLPLIPPELESSSSDPLNPPYLPLPPPLQTPATPATQSLLPSSHSSNNSASSQWHGNTSGLLGAISAWMMEARGSTSYLCALLSSLTCRPGSCAPSSLVSSTRTIGHSDSSGTLRQSAPPGSDIAPPSPQTWGPSAALRPYTPTALASPVLPQAPPLPSVTSASPLTSGFPLPSHRCGSVAAAKVFGVPALHKLPGCAVGSTSYVIVASGHPYGTVWTPSSSGTTVESSSGCDLGYHLSVHVQGHSLDHTTLFRSSSSLSAVYR